MNYLLSFIKNPKILVYGLGVGLVLFLSYQGLSQVKESIYNDGYNTAVIKYESELNSQLLQQQKDTILQLQELHAQYILDKEKAVQQALAEHEVDKGVDTITEYIREEIHVQDTCNVVPVDLNSMFNNTIRSINQSP